MNIRQATLADLPTIVALHAQCFAQGWDEEFLGRILAQPGAFAFLAIEQDALAGFVLVRAAVGEAEILSLGISPDMRRRGIGAALIRTACLHADEAGVLDVFLEVSVENAAARELYAHLGFREVGRRADYYEDAVGTARDALVLRRALPLYELQDCRT
jgi:ribosomal-protein-alanine N-acetyltransferase